MNNKKWLYTHTYTHTYSLMYIYPSSLSLKKPTDTCCKWPSVFPRETWKGILETNKERGSLAQKEFQVRLDCIICHSLPLGCKCPYSLCSGLFQATVSSSSSSVHWDRRKIPREAAISWEAREQMTNKHQGGGRRNRPLSLQAHPSHIAEFLMYRK